MFKFLQAVRAFIAHMDFRDSIVFSGLAFVFMGLWQIYSPAAWVVIGSALFWLGARR